MKGVELHFQRGWTTLADPSNMTLKLCISRITLQQDVMMTKVLQKIILVTKVTLEFYCPSVQILNIKTSELVNLTVHYSQTKAINSNPTFNRFSFQ